MKSLHWVLWIALAAVFSPMAGAQGERNQYGPKPSGEPAALAQYKANLEACKANPDKLVLPGLVADRKARTVEVLAESTGLKEGDIAEFLLVDQTSDRGYEALLWSYAKPSAVHRALTFIGLEPGSPFNPAALRFWPSGDRVILTVRKADGKRFPIERLVLDKETDATLNEEGFVFAGSLMVPPQDGKGESLYGADVEEARPVASVFNDPVTVLDVPRQASKGDVYGKQVVNSGDSLSAGELVTIVMTPGDPEGKRNARHLVLSLDKLAGTNGLSCRLAEAGGKVLQQAAAITPMLEQLVAFSKGGAKVYVALSIGDALPLGEARKLCVVMAMMENMGGIRIEPPVAGQLYYRAFVPDKSWLTPEGRPSQPWELHLLHKKDGGGVAGQLVWHEEVWPEEKTQDKSYKRVAYDVADAKALGARLGKDTADRLAAGKGVPPSVLLVFADPALNYGETLAFLAPVLKTNYTVYVFVEAGAP